MAFVSGRVRQLAIFLRQRRGLGIAGNKSLDRGPFWRHRGFSPRLRRQRFSISKPYGKKRVPISGLLSRRIARLATRLPGFTGQINGPVFRWLWLISSISRGRRRANFALSERRLGVDRWRWRRPVRAWQGRQQAVPLRGGVAGEVPLSCRTRHDEALREFCVTRGRRPAAQGRSRPGLAGRSSPEKAAKGAVLGLRRRRPQTQGRWWCGRGWTCAARSGPARDKLLVTSRDTIGQAPQLGFAVQ